MDAISYEEVEQVLGIRKNTQKKNLRQYVVTVIPSIVAYAGGWKGDSYDVEVSASSHTNAITKVRQQELRRKLKAVKKEANRPKQD